MKKEIFTIAELTTLGFQELQGDKLDEGGYYTWYGFYKNESEIHITYEYGQEGAFDLGYVEFNGEVLTGREITKSDVEFLMELM